MKVCCCQLAGTNTCESCGGNNLLSHLNKTITQQDIDNARIRQIDKQIEMLRHEKELLQLGCGVLRY